MGRSDKISVVQGKKISYEGYFEANEIYKNLKKYLEEELHYSPSEKEHEEKDTGGKRKIVSKIEATAQYNDYYAIVIKFFLEMSGKEVEIEDKGKKRLVTQGTATLSINSWVNPDYTGTREKGPLGEFIGKIYDKFLAKEELDKATDKAGGDVGKVVAFFKKEVNSKLQ